MEVPRLLARISALLRAREAPATLIRPAKIEHLMELVAFAVEAARAAGAGEEAAHAVHLAVEEVCLNVMTHGYRGAAGPVRVAVERREDALEIHIADEAPLFDPAHAPRPRLDVPLEERQPGGLGWHLVREVMDEVRHEPAHPVGNVVTLVKRLAQRPAAT